MCLPIPGSSKSSCEPVFLFIQYIEHTKPKCTHPVPTFPHSATFLQREYFTQYSETHNLVSLLIILKWKTQVSASSSESAVL